MDLRSFIAARRPAWELIEGLLDRAGRYGLRSLEPGELRDLGLLHRQVSADLAAARTFHDGSRVVDYLNDLALRSHNVVYRTPRRGVRSVLSGLARSVPRTVRARGGAVVASMLLFACGTLLGAVGALLDESTAIAMLGPEFIESIRNGEYLSQGIFTLVPHSVASTHLLSNNMTVALNLYATGITGIFPAVILTLNGAILGAVFVLCGRYELLARFLAFVVPHGVLEVSAILIAGAAAFATFDGWLHPGNRNRVEGLRRGAADGLRMLGAVVPALLIAAVVEGFLSGQAAIPAAVRVAIGIGLGAMFWIWLLAGGRDETKAYPGA